MGDPIYAQEFQSFIFLSPICADIHLKAKYLSSFHKLHIQNFCS